MKNRIISIAIIFVMLFSFVFAASADSGDIVVFEQVERTLPLVVDNADLLTDEQEKARLALLSFTDGSDAAKIAIDNLNKSFSSGAASSFEASQAFGEVEENLKNIPDHSVRISESFAKITSSLMSLNA